MLKYNMILIQLMLERSRCLTIESAIALPSRMDLRKLPALTGARQLPRDGALWVLRWYGGVFHPPERPHVVCFQGIFARLRRPDWFRSGITSVHDDRIYDRETITSPLIAELPITLLHAFQLGSVWKDGKWCGDLGGSESEFDLDTRTTENWPSKGKGADRIANDRHGSTPKGSPFLWEKLIPDDQYSLSWNARHGWVLVLRLPGDGSDDGLERRLVLPMLEVARFYYCRTGRMAHAIFHNHLVVQPGIIKPNGVYDEELSVLDPLTGRPFVQLRNGFREADVWTALRLCYDLVAAEGAKSLYLTSQESLNKGTGQWPESTQTTPFVAFPKTNFPFKARTQLRVWGREFISGKYRTLLGLRILSCSAPFPFSDKDPLYRIDNSNDPSPTMGATLEDGAFMGAQHGAPVKPGASSSEDTFEPQEPAIHPDDPEGYLAGFEFFHENDELRGTSGRRLERRYKAPTHGSTGSGPPPPGAESHGYSVDVDPSSGTGLTGISPGMEDGNKAPQPSLQRELQTFLDAIRILESSGHKCRPVTVADAEAGVPDHLACSFFPTFLPWKLQSDYNKRPSLPWIYLTKDFKRRLDPARRRVAITCVEDDPNRPFYLIEVERRPNSQESFGTHLLRHADWARLDDGGNEAKLRSVLHEFILEGRPAIDPQRHKGLQMVSVPHPNNGEPQALATRLESWIQRVLEASDGSGGSTSLWV